MTKTEELAALLAATGHAHHNAYLATDGYDPEWPTWYAERAVADVNELLGSDLDPMQLRDLILEADRLAPADVPWAEAYAAHIVGATD
jgi:hypothetical protein